MRTLTVTGGQEMDDRAGPTMTVQDEAAVATQGHPEIITEVAVLAVAAAAVAVAAIIRIAITINSRSFTSSVAVTFVPMKV